MIILGYLSSILIGITLGMMGGGGSILTVPVFVYLFGVDAIPATTYSLFIVGVTSAVGSINYFIKGLVNFKTILLFGIPSILSVMFARGVVVPLLPQEIVSFGNININKDIFILLVFSMMMIAASISMIKKNKIIKDELEEPKYLMIVFQGIVVGSMMGIVGAGGGFLIIPAFVHYLKMPMKVAIGTSLSIITINSLFGFVVSMVQIEINWILILSVSAIAIVGILIGGKLAQRIDERKLKKIFGWFIFLMGLFIISRELISN